LKDGSLHELKPSEIAPGTRLTVYYKTETKHVDGKKVKINTIFQLKVVPDRAKR
jgi:hypothetical protein